MSETNRINVIREAVDRARAKKAGFVRIPRSFLTEVMRHLNEAELKAALVVALETIGRDLDRSNDCGNAISWRRFQELGGLSRTAAYRALKTVVKANVASAEQRRDEAGDLAASIYRPTILPAYECNGVVSAVKPGSSKNGTTPGSANATTGSSDSGTRVVPKLEPSLEEESESRPQREMDFDFEAWFESRYGRHPKKGHRASAQRALSQLTAVLDPEWRAEFERVHDLHISSERWLWKGGAGAPWFDEWIIDQGWRYEPTIEQNSSRRAMDGI